MNIIDIFHLRLFFVILLEYLLFKVMGSLSVFEVLAPIVFVIFKKLRQIFLTLLPGTYRERTFWAFALKTGFKNNRFQLQGRGTMTLTLSILGHYGQKLSLREPTSISFIEATEMKVIPIATF